MSPLGSLLRFFRNERNITPAELGRPLKLDRKDISALETGRLGPPDEAVLLKIRDVLHLTSTEYQALLDAARHSTRTVRIPRQTSPGKFRLVHELMHSLDDLNPSQVDEIRRVIHRRSA